MFNSTGRAIIYYVCYAQQRRSTAIYFIAITVDFTADSYYDSCAVWSHQSRLYWPRRFEFRSLAVGRCDDRGQNCTINGCPFRSHRIESKHDDDWALATWNLIAMVSLASHIPLAQNELVGCRAKASTHAATFEMTSCLEIDVLNSRIRDGIIQIIIVHVFKTRTLFNIHQIVLFVFGSTIYEYRNGTRLHNVAVSQSYAVPRISTFGLNDELNIVESSRIWSCGTSA